MKCNQRVYSEANDTIHVQYIYITLMNGDLDENNIIMLSNDLSFQNRSLLITYLNLRRPFVFISTVAVSKILKVKVSYIINRSHSQLLSMADVYGASPWQLCCCCFCY